MAAKERAVKKPKRSRPLQVAEQIKGWVVERDLKDGAALPNEAEMIAQFGVSKGTTREALRILEAEGLIVTRTGPGGGSFVSQVSEDRASALLANYFYFHELSIADLYQMRRALEPELASGLAGRLTQEQIDALRDVVGRYPEPARDANEEKEQHIASLTFHAQLAGYASNPLLRFMIGFIVQVLTDLTVFRRLYEPPNQVLWEKGRGFQLDLLEAMERGDADRARGIMREHMETAEALMNQQEAKVVRRFIPG